jgi:two-component system response regulator DctR
MVHIIDNEEEIRNSLVWLAGSRAIEATSYDTAQSFLAVLDKTFVFDVVGDCVLTDVEMSGVDGLELFDRLAARNLLHRMPVIFLTGHGKVAMATDMLRRGAFDFFEKPFDAKKLICRVQDALDASKKARAISEVQRNLDTLSARECEVLCLLLSGSVNNDIANRLGISTRTIEVHRAHLFKKMKVRSAVEIALVLAQHIDIYAYMREWSVSELSDFVPGEAMR